MPVIRIEFDSQNLELLIKALDSHVYWQLSDRRYRRDGYVLEPGSDNPEVAKEICRINKLIARL